MAIFNEIGIGRWNRFIQKLTDIKGGPPARQLSSEINFAHPIFHGAENRYLESWDLFGISQAPTGGAAQLAGVRLRNPAGSNIIAVLAGVILTSNVAANFSVFQTQLSADLTTVAANTFSRLDARGRQQPTLVTSSTTNYGAIPGVQAVNNSLGAGIPLQVISYDAQELPLLPGNTWDFVTSTVAITFGVSVLWRERLLEPAERI